METTKAKQRKRKGGFTLAEFLVVIAITMILAGVSFVAVIRYQSRLRRLEMDQTAKEIFLAAQNNLSLDASSGVFERLLVQTTGTQTEEKLGISLTAEGTDGIYCILYQPGGEDPCKEIRERLLPFGSIDETVRVNGSYLIFYEPAAGAVRAVWYSDQYVFVRDDIESTTLSEAALDDTKRERYTGMNDAFADHGQPIGYYAGDASKTPGVITPSAVLKQPTLKVTNDSVLYVDVIDPNLENSISHDPNYQAKLYIEGVTSKAKGWMKLEAGGRISYIITSNAYRVILDDITTAGHHFAQLKDVGSGVTFLTDKRLIPGEDIRLYAQVSVSGQAGSIATSAVSQENSIFAGKRTDKVLVSNLRHLENLDYTISGFNPEVDSQILGLIPKDSDGKKQYTALQQADISWTGFVQNLQLVTGDHTPSVYALENGKNTGAGCFAPVSPQFALDYRGNSYSISGLTVKTSGEEPGGLFGNVTRNLKVSQLKLNQLDITSPASAGALIGCGKAAGLTIQVEDVKLFYPKVLSVGTKGGITSSKEIDSGAVIGNFEGKQLIIQNTIAANQFWKKISEPQALLSVQDETACRIRSTWGIAGGLAGAVKGSVQFKNSAASVYVDAWDYAGGLVGAVRTVTENQTVSVDSCYVGGHTSGKKFLSDPVPGAQNDAYDQKQGRFNIVSRNNTAGGLAAVLPTVSTVSHTYVSASVYAIAHGDVVKTEIPESQENPDGSGTSEATGRTQQVTEATEKQKKAAFIALFGDTERGGEGDLQGAAASDSRFSYCYTAVWINGASALVYSDAWKAKFEEENAFHSKAIPYDAALKTDPETPYPMPTVYHLNALDKTNGNTQNLPGFLKLHVGDWQENVKEEAAENGLTIHNGNRLWVEYVMDMPENTGTGTNAVMKYLTFSVEGALSHKPVYYVVEVDCHDLSASRYMVLDDKNKVTLDEWAKEGAQTLSNQSKRIELTSEAGKLKVNFYLDNLSVSSGGYQALTSLYNSGNQNILTAGENITIRACEEVRVPDDSDPKKETNSMFADISENGDGTYTASVSNIRHLENLNFFGSQWMNPQNRIKVTKVVQTDNILWGEDSDISSNTEAYDKEISDAYGINQIYNGNSVPMQQGSFCPIENEELLSYDGGKYTIANLNMEARQDSDKGTSLFVKNNHLSVFNLSIKNPVSNASKAAAAILLQQAGEYNTGSSDGSYLRLQNVRVYGDNIKINSDGNAYIGGLVACANVDELELDHVSFYGKRAMIEKTSDGLAGGGLIGNANVREKFLMNQCMFSGYLSGRKFSQGSGGLIGRLALSDTMQETSGTVGQITNCYVAGRNQSYDEENSESLNNQPQISITGMKYTGGLIGFGTGPLRIVNSFSMAGIRGFESGSGGLIGCYQNPENLELVQCYFGGIIKKEPGNFDRGILIGQTIDSGWQTRTVFTGKLSECAYIQRSGFETMRIVGSASEKDGAAQKCVPGDISMKKILIPGTSGITVLTYPYDESLRESKMTYPYNIWTTELGEDGKTELPVYRGDWIAE